MAGAPGILKFSDAQSPKSTCWQRLEQNGLKGDCSPQATGFLQVGQLIVVTVF